MPVAGRRRIASALVVDERGFVIDCGRGAPSAGVDGALDFRCLEAMFVTHSAPTTLAISLACCCIRGGVEPMPRSAATDRCVPSWLTGALLSGDAMFRRQTTMDPAHPVPGTTDLAEYPCRPRI
jgi:hypothetical protein